MKYLFLLLFPFIVFSTESPKNKKTDSILYYLELSQLNSKTDEYEKGIQSNQKSFVFTTKNERSLKVAKSYSSLGQLYFEKRKYDKAIILLSKSISIFNKFKPSLDEAFTCFTLGLCYMEFGDFPKAEIHFHKAEKMYSLIKIPNAVELLKLQKGIVYQLEGNYSRATAIYKSIITNKDETDQYGIKAKAFYQLGTINLKKDKLNLALNNFNNALIKSRSIANPDFKLQVYKALIYVHEKKHDIQNSLFYQKKYSNLKKKAVAQKKTLIAANDSEHKVQEQLKTIVEMDKENKQTEKENLFYKIINVLALLLISVLSVFSLFLFKSNKTREKTNLLLESKNEELQTAKDNAEKATKARSEFISTVSHELRTPLNAIIGITYLLKEEEPKESQIEYLKSLEFSGNYLMKFINEILEVNRIESGMIEVENTYFNLDVLIQDIRKSLIDFDIQNNNTLVLNLDENIPQNLLGDPTRLSQIFMNLINNSLKFTHEGTITVTTRLCAINSEKASVYIEVTDDGIGIPKDRLESIFDSFSQGSVEINRKYGGTGLGLNIVKKLVAILGGTIKVESTEFLGSKFYFTLDFKFDQSKPIKANSILDFSFLSGKKILLVEDNKINQLITQKILKNKNLFCETIDNGEDAIELVRNNTYDLVLMDVHLPGINGTFATQAIRTFNTQLPIIALTAISLNENRQSLLEFGMDDVITKPFDPVDFYTIIAKNLK
jgi:signal transduction histidine kinase